MESPRRRESVSCLLPRRTGASRTRSRPACQALRMRTARRAAFLALSIPTQATGTPPGTCAVASRASRWPASGSTPPRTPLSSRSASSTPDMRVGIGYDSHRFVEGEGRKLILGGVEIPYSRGLVGHSDADAVAHALTDAILGAAGLGDIGQMFPPTDPRWRDADSLDLLKRAYLRVVEAGLSFVSADITVIIEQPKLARYLDDMRENLAGALVSGFSTVS